MTFFAIAVSEKFEFFEDYIKLLNIISEDWKTEEKVKRQIMLRGAKDF